MERRLMMTITAAAIRKRWFSKPGSTDDLGWLSVP